MKQNSMKTFKKGALLAALTVTLGLAACSHENPLEKQPNAETRHFLSEASTAAEMQMNFKTNMHGLKYQACMLGRVDTPGFCDELYADMVTYAVNSKGPFRSLTLEDLKNETLFRKIYDLPEHSSFNDVPEQ